MSSGQRKKAVVTLSGGLDSTVAAFVAAQDSELVLGLTFDYGQKAMRRELGAGYAVAQRLGIPHRVVQLPFFRIFEGSALLDRSRAVPDLAAAKLDDVGGAAKASAAAVWVPNRNGIFVAIAAAFAEHLGADRVVVGFNAEEAATFSDNSMDFVRAQNDALHFSTANGVEVAAPTGTWVKSDIVRFAVENEVPLELCWPCYNDPDEKRPCGACESCRRFDRAVVAANAAEWLANRRGGRT